MHDVSVRLQPADEHQSPAVKPPKHKRVPRKPTNPMIAAGAAAGGVSPDVAWRVYRAMIDAVANEFGVGDSSDIVFIPGKVTAA